MGLLTSILVCLLLSAFFSGMEIAFTASNKLQIEINKSDKSIAQALIDLFVSHSGMYITTMLVGNNIVMVIYGIFMKAYLIDRIPFLGGLSMGMQLVVETLLSTVVILIFAEFLPKTLFRLRPNGFLRAFAVPVFLFYLIFFPITYFSVWLGGAILHLFTGRKMQDTEQDRAFGKVDLNHLIDEGEVPEESHEEVHEIKLFRNALDFSEVKLRECIVPRTDLKALPLDATMEELREMFIATGLSRILIYRENTDNIIGYVHSSSLFKHPKNIADALVGVIIVPETMSASHLLNLFIKQQRSIAVVVDEFGVTAGIVTIEDIMEEIFGEIEDEHDLTVLKEEKVSDSEYIFSGRLEVDYLNEKYGLELPENEEYETVAGCVLYYNESIPAEGDRIEIGKYAIEILSVKNARIEEIKVMV